MLENDSLLVTADEAAAMCACSAKLWRSRCSYGLTPKPVRVGRRHYWKRAEVIAWVDAGCPRRDDWLWPVPMKHGRNPRNPS